MSHGKHEEVAVSVITPEGVYPDEEFFRRALAEDPVISVLDMAKSKLEIKDTKDWVVHVLGEDKKVIDPSETFKKLGLKCIVEIEWHKGEGGGGA